MKKGRAIAAICLLVVVLAGVTWRLVFRNREPVYQGRPMSFWLAQYNSTMWLGGTPYVHDPPSDKRQAVQAEASNALREIGTNGVPGLLSLLAARESPLTHKLLKMPWSRRLTNRFFYNLRHVFAEFQNREATWGFKVLGPDAAFAVPDLIKIYERSNSFWSKEATAQALGFIGPSARAAIPTLLKNATNSDIQVRRDAINAIMFISAEPDIVVPAMVSALHDADQAVRWNAAVVLGDYGVKAKSALPALMEARDDVAIKDSVETALRQIDPDAAAKAGIKYP